MPCHLPDANSLVNSQNLFIFVLTVCKEKSKVCSLFGPSEEEGYLNMLDLVTSGSFCVRLTIQFHFNFAQVDSEIH